jgi:hypothetical protein
MFNNISVLRQRSAQLMEMKLPDSLLLDQNPCKRLEIIFLCL